MPGAAGTPRAGLGAGYEQGYGQHCNPEYRCPVDVTNVYRDGTKEEYDFEQDASILRPVTGSAFGGGLVRASLGVLLDSPSTSESHDRSTHFSCAVLLLVRSSASGESSRRPRP